MNAKIMDGRALALELRRALKKKIKENKESPQIAVILVGDNPASEVYVRQKQKAAQLVGISLQIERLPNDVSEARLFETQERLNLDPNICGYILQAPLPFHLNTFEALRRIDINKDIDCLNPENLGLVAESKARFLPCTPIGIINLLKKYNVPLKGAVMTIIGRSRIVGRPLALMATTKDATVIVCHTKTQDIFKHTREANIIIAAAGVPELIKSDAISEGAVLVDVGINRVDGRLVGDVDFLDCSKKAALISPVPGGVGPMTVVSLLENAYNAWLYQKNRR